MLYQTLLILKQGVEEELGWDPVERFDQRIERVGPLRQDPPGIEVGVVLHFDAAAVAVANLGDEWIVGPWPSDAWSDVDVAELV